MADKKGGKDVGYFGSDQGILRVSAPEKRGGQWKTELIMEGHIGEIATIDIDNDGEDEIMTIEEFHGDTIQIYKRLMENIQKSGSTIMKSILHMPLLEQN